MKKELGKTLKKQEGTQKKKNLSAALRKNLMRRKVGNQKVENVAESAQSK